MSDRSAPSGFRITVKRMPAPAAQPGLPSGASSSHFHDHVKVGDVLKLKAPSGQFFIDPNASVPAVLIAGGIGITPMMNMLRWSVTEQPERAAYLYYGVRNRGDHAFKLNVVYSSPEADDRLARDYQHTGHVDLPLLRRTLPHGRHQFYVCRPPPMMLNLVPAVRE